MKVSGIFLLIAILSGFSGPRCGAAVYHSDGSAANVQQIHDTQAVDGDTITIPNGTFSWTSTLHLTKQITLIGNTTTDPVHGTAVQNTIVQDNISDRNTAIISIDANGGQRISGIAFIGLNTGTMYNGGIRLESGATPIRIDHCYFHGLHCFPNIGVFAKNWGVIDHCVKDDSVAGNEGFVHFWPGSHTDMGDSLFEVPAGWGGPNFLFLEDNYMNGGTDITAGGKMCVRHCIITNNNSLGSHGTARAFPNGRGGRAYEVYNCQFRYTNNSSSIDGPDGGSAVYHDNTVSPHTYGIASQVYRAFQSYGAPFYLADGNNAWDLNDPQTHRPLRILDQPGLGAGAHINRNAPAWPNQANEPMYSWNNTNTDDGSRFGYTVSVNGGFTILAGRDYFNNTVMPGYTPYTYPHPLVSAGGGGGGGGASPRAVVTDFNSDGHPDYVLQSAGTRQTAIWYLNNNFYMGGAYGPTLVAGWALMGLADFNLDNHSDYALFAPNTNQTALWYLSGPRFIRGAYAPTLPNGWELVATADFNGDSRPDYVLYNSGTHQTAIWYMNNNVYVGGGYGPTLPPGWDVIGVADFNGDGHPDYAVIYASTGQTAIGYLSGLTLVGAASGPTLPGGWALVATADFNGDGKPDYVLYKAGPRQTAIWYLNNNVFVSSAYGPSLPNGWSLIAP
jgi:VCBS repeat protein